jgi:predicted Fe-Mo cluster-binding NifX family protein
MEVTMKIAVSTSDGKSVCGHLGKCTQFLVYEADGFDILNRHLIRTHGVFAHYCSEPLNNCQAVITQGMGQGMYDGLVKAGIIPVLTSETDPETAVQQFLCGGITGAYQGNCSCGGH